MDLENLSLDTQENRQKALKSYILRYRKLDNMRENKKGRRIQAAFYRHKESIPDTVESLGFQVEDVYRLMPKKYFYTLTRVIKRVETFTREEKKFPTMRDFQSKLRIDTRVVRMHGIEKIKQEVGWVDTEDEKHHSWLTRDERLTALKTYIEERLNLNHMDKNRMGRSIQQAFSKRNESIHEAAVELGYSVVKLYPGHIPKNYYRGDFAKVERKIREYMSQNNNVYPTKVQIIKILRIDQRSIQHHGGIQGIKKQMNITKGELIDLRGDYNRSTYEWQVANFLVAQGLKDFYEREITRSQTKAITVRISLLP